MVRRIPCGWGLLVALVGCAPPHASPDFRSLYDHYERAVRDMDSTAYKSMFTDDFSMTNPNGSVHDRAEMLRYQSINAITTKRVTEYSVAIESVTPVEHGDYAVIVLQKYERDQAPLEQPDQPHRIGTSVVQREIWHQDHGRWRIRRIEELLTGPVLLDGKILQP